MESHTAAQLPNAGITSHISPSDNTIEVSVITIIHIASAEITVAIITVQHINPHIRILASVLHRVVSDRVMVLNGFCRRLTCR